MFGNVWLEGEDLNLWPFAYQANALPAELPSNTNCFKEQILGEVHKPSVSVPCLAPIICGAKSLSE